MLWLWVSAAWHFKGNKFFTNARNQSTIDISYPKRPEFSEAELWEAQLSYLNPTKCTYTYWARAPHLHVGAVPCFRRLHANLSQQRPEFDPRPVRVESAVDKGAVEKVFSEYFGFPLLV